MLVIFYSVTIIAAILIQYKSATQVKLNRCTNVWLILLTKQVFNIFFGKAFHKAAIVGN
jgi:hypothetical protein